MMEEIVGLNNVPQSIYKPSEIIGIFNSILAKQSVNAQVVFLRGVYLASARQNYGGYFYDTLRDEDRQEEITIIVTQPQRENLKNGNLVNVGGVIGRNVNNRGQIQIHLNVSRIEVVQEQVIDEAEIKRAELRQLKAKKGFKNVDSLLEQLIFCDQRPKVALLFATSSITMSDFEAGVNASRVAIDFKEYRVNFSNANELVNMLHRLDEEKHDIIAVVRGGGGGIEKLDDLSVLEAVVNLKTPIIAAIGHVEEKLFIKQIVDKEAPTPNGLGQYFSSMVEEISEKKTRSRAALTEQIKKQFKDQLEAGQKQNKELQQRLVLMTKAQEEATKAQQEATKKHNEQVLAAQKQNQELQKQLKDLTESQKKQADEQKKHQEELGKSIQQMQQTNTQLQTNLNKITAQNAESLKELALAKERAKDLERQLSEAKQRNNKGCLGLIALIIGFTAMACMAVIIMI